MLLNISRQLLKPFDQELFGKQIHLIEDDLCYLLSRAQGVGKAESQR